MWEASAVSILPAVHPAIHRPASFPSRCIEVHLMWFSPSDIATDVTVAIGETGYNSIDTYMAVFYVLFLLIAFLVFAVVVVVVVLALAVVGRARDRGRGF